MKHLSIYFMAALLAAVSLSAWPHGGEDHGAAATPLPAAAVAPRAVAQSEEFELVAVLDGKKLVLTLDRFATNEPVADAQIEVDSGALKAEATQVAAGVYSIPGESFAAPGKYPLAISVQAGDSSDLLSATLDISQPAAGVEHVHAWGEWAVWAVSGALLLVGAALVAMRRRRNSNR